MKNTKNIVIVGMLVLAVAVIVTVKNNKQKLAEAQNKMPPSSTLAASTETLPRLLDLGAGTCIPCKMMAPILENLRTTYAGKLRVDFIDVSLSPDEAKKFAVNIIPTQIFYDSKGKELFRHEGFFGKDDILAKWKEFGVDLPVEQAILSGTQATPSVSRWLPVQPDSRSQDAICYLCDGAIASNNSVVVKTDKGDVQLCGMHHYFVMYSCLTGDKTGFETKVQVSDWSTGALVPIQNAVYVHSRDAKTGRPLVKAFASKEAAATEQQANGGDVVDLAALQKKELANTCGFCDRAVYKADSTGVAVIVMRASCCGERAIPEQWLSACCPMCALGICAKLQKDIELTQKDALTGENIIVRTSELKFGWATPSSAVAWYGQRRGKDGTTSSSGCFHQFFFTSEENLRTWLEKHPEETGSMITIQKALEDKMALTPQQISNACKIGECAPK